MQTPKNMDRLTAQFVRDHAGFCACVPMDTRQKVFYCLLAVFLLFLLKFRWDYFVFAVTFFLMICYLAAVFLRLAAAWMSLAGRGQTISNAEDLKNLSDDELPVYTILLPMYHESAVADKILRRIGALDYPKAKLDVKLLLESDDDETRTAIQQQGLPFWCEIVDIPPGSPRTKPRACNYGLEAAKGEFCVIYDAEDAPEADQLKKAVLAFRTQNADGRLLCVQARLNYYNAGQNWLTRFFTIEYSTYFDLTLGGLQTFRLPLPLGGTSNHFRTGELKQIGGWDPFNVTEDCDLGIRLYEQGWRTVVLDSTTWEEANSQLWNWMRQRSRWVKGFVQTHLVHFRHPADTVARLSLRGAAGCYIFVGGSVIMMLTNLIFWPLIVLYFLLLAHGLTHGETLAGMLVGPHSGAELYEGIRIGVWRIQAWPLIYSGPMENPVLSGASKVFFCTGVFLFMSNLLLILIHAAACWKRGFKFLIPWSFLMPFYWVLISLGAWKGAVQFLTNPFYWEKTVHGLNPSTNKKLFCVPSSKSC